MALLSASEASLIDPMTQSYHLHRCFSTMKFFIAVVLCLLINSSSVACNIPVFRYALERWQPDSCELIVFHKGPLSPDQQQLLQELDGQRTKREDSASTSLTLSDLSAPTPTHASLWQSITSTTKQVAATPYLVVRMKLGKGRTINGWHGSLSDAVKIGILDSPARRELARRLLAGHSVVWLMIRPGKESRLASEVRELNTSTQKSLAVNFPLLSQELTLPEGIGLPGSELHSEIPLLLKFSLLEIERDDPREAFLVNLFSQIQPEASEQGEALIVPVFGRGRALEVIPASSLTSQLMKDLTVFLSGACSCQVKEQNPGFDLLMSVDWESELFGEGIAPPRVRSTRDRLNKQPELLSIPPGK